ncbi:hypothetical protein D9M70_646720 [compost metagenome]
MNPGTPALAQVPKHAHGFDDFGVAQALVGKRGGGHMLTVGAMQRTIGELVVDVRQPHEQQGADHAHPAIPGMENEHHR